MPVSNGYLTKIITEKARGECPDFIEPAIVNEVQKALVGKRLEEVAHSAPGPQKTMLAPQSPKVVKPNGGRYRPLSSKK